MLKELKILLKEREITFKYRNNHIPCFPHVVNLCTQSIIKALTDPERFGTDDNSDDEDNKDEDIVDSEDDDEPEPEEPETEESGSDARSSNSDSDDPTSNAKADAAADQSKQKSSNKDPKGARKGATTVSEAIKNDVISLTRKIVREFRKSGQRREAFLEMIEVGNKKGWFTLDGQSVPVQPLQFLRDVRHRWDSVFLMIRRILELQPVSLIVISLINLALTPVIRQSSVLFQRTFMNLIICVFQMQSGTYWVRSR
jgi:hypothetical protein